MTKRIVPYENHIGNKFGNLKILGIDRNYKKPKFIILCDCGMEKLSSAMDVVAGKIKSCGCMTWRFPFKALKKERQAWSDMKQRCLSQNHKWYPSYGGRCITICERWMKFENFIEDMGAAPSKEHSLDRINNDGNYETKNCRWATKQEQVTNRSIPSLPSRLVKCQTCMKYFYETNSELRKKKFNIRCSYACRKNGQESKCQHCGKYFYVTKSLADTKKFCSRECRSLETIFNKMRL